MGQDLEQLCHTVGCKGYWTQSHREGRVSKVPLGNLSLAGCRVMTICCLCQGFGLHKAGGSVRAARTEDLQQGGAEHRDKAAAARGAARAGAPCRYQGGVTAAGLAVQHRELQGSQLSSWQRRARLWRGCRHNPEPWRGRELKFSAPEVIVL